MYKHIHYLRVLLILLIISLTSCTPHNFTPKVVGEMKNVMWNGELMGIIDLDTISNKSHLYALGPVEYLSGEILVYDGRAYKSSVVNDSTMIVEETYSLKAPFLAYANISQWKKQTLPNDLQTIKQLEVFLEKQTSESQKPFMFKMVGTVPSAKIHVVNLPKGTQVSSPEEAHMGLTDFNLQGAEVIILGFFSTNHKTIFTHHDTYVHMHLITNDKMQMGHLDDIVFDPKTITLYLPDNNG